MNTFPMERRNTLHKTSLMIVTAMILLVSSCKKGDTGPAGPAGPAGATGAAGPQGPAGSANVIYTAWYTPSPYIKDTIFGIYGFSYTKTFSDITQNIVDSGTVITFGKLLGYNTQIWLTTQVSQLPITLTYVQGTTMSDTWSSLVSAGKVKIRFVNDHNYYGSISTAHQFRVVIIPGGKAATAAAGTKVYTRSGRIMGAEQYNANIQEVARGYQSMSYAEICDKLGIPQ